MQDETTTEPARPQHLRLDIDGMHCVNCVVAVERCLRKLRGIQTARASYPPGQAVISHTGELDLQHVHDALKDEGYSVRDVQAVDEPTLQPHTPRDFLEIAAAFVILIGIALAVQHFRLLPRGFSVSDQMSYGLVFLIGLVASVSSCLAVTGGLLVALAAKYNETNPYLTDRQRFIPPLYFNAGRIISYTLFGGAIGALGAALTLTPAATGALTLIASALMIALGLNMLGFLPSVGRYLPSLAPSLAHRLHDAASKETKGAAFLLGAATFFLPCGFTQALQLYVLTKASFTVGALTMLAFAIGTLPALLSLSAISSLAKGAFQKHFLRFAGAAVILLGILNVQYGLVLTGSDLGRSVVASANGVTAEVEPDGKSQRMSMKVVDLDYEPHQFTVKQGILVKWWIDGSQAAGCGRILVAPNLGIQKVLSANSTTLITFTPRQPGEYAFNCGMGMMTADARITVVPN
jgi:uncharacterized protein